MTNERFVTDFRMTNESKAPVLPGLDYDNWAQGTQNAGKVINR
jgi:hypothetical protein